MSETTQKHIKITNLEAEKFELETSKGTHILQLSNEAIKKADEMAFINKSKEMGISELLTNLIFIYSIRHNPSCTPNLAKKIVSTIIDDKEYDIAELVSDLIDDFIIQTNKVFTSGEAKKSLKKI